MTLLHEAVGHQNYLSCLAFSPSGEQILSGSRDGTAKLWDLATGKRLRTFRWGADAIVGVAWSPDGTRLAIAGTPPPRVYSKTEAERLFAFRRGERSAREYSADPTSTRFSQLRVYRAMNGELLYTFDDAGCGVVFAADNRSLAATNWDGLLIIDLITGARKSSPLHHNLTNPIYSRSGTEIACFGDYGVYVFDAVTADLLRIAHDPHVFGNPATTENLGSFETLRDLPMELPEQEFLAHHLRFWREILPEFEPQSFPERSHIHRIAFSPDQARVVFEPSVNQKHAWSNYDWQNPVLLALVNRKQQETMSFLRNPNLHFLATAAFSPDGKCLAWGGSTQTVDWMWLENGECWSTDDSPPALTALCLAPATYHVAIGADDGRIMVCDWESMGVLTIFPAFEDAIKHVEFSPDGKWLLAASQQGLIKLIDVSSFETIIEIAAHRAQFLGGLFTPDGTQFISLGYAEIPRGSSPVKPVEMIRWSLPDGAVAESLILPEQLRVRSTSAAPNRSQIAISSRYAVHLADITGKLSCQTLLEYEEPGSVKFLRDSACILMAAGSFGMQIMNVSSLRISNLCEAINDGPISVAFNSTSSRLIRASHYSSELEFFDVDAWQYLRQFVGHVNGVNCVEFLPDDRRALSAGEDGTLKLWDTDTGRLLASLVLFAEPGSDGRGWECIKPQCEKKPPDS